MIFQVVLLTTLLYKSIEAKGEKSESHLGRWSDGMMAPYLPKEFLCKVTFFNFTTLKFHPTNPKAMNRYSLGACAEVDLAINLTVALEIISLHVILVEESSPTK